MQAGSTRVVDDDEEEEPSCSIADLHCSRKEANAHAGIKDIHGVVGAACDHGCPVYNSFMDIPSPEQFIYYLILLQILASFAILRDVYVDFGCRLNSTWKKFVFIPYHLWFPHHCQLDACLVSRGEVSCCQQWPPSY